MLRGNKSGMRKIIYLSVLFLFANNNSAQISNYFLQPGKQYIHTTGLKIKTEYYRPLPGKSSYETNKTYYDTTGKPIHRISNAVSRFGVKNSKRKWAYEQSKDSNETHYFYIDTLLSKETYKKYSSVLNAYSYDSVTYTYETEKSTKVRHYTNGKLKSYEHYYIADSIYIEKIYDTRIGDSTPTLFKEIRLNNREEIVYYKDSVFTTYVYTESRKGKTKTSYAYLNDTLVKKSITTIKKRKRTHQYYTYLGERVTYSKTVFISRRNKKIYTHISRYGKSRELQIFDSKRRIIFDRLYWKRLRRSKNGGPKRYFYKYVYEY
jgi:hypothetical protein